MTMTIINNKIKTQNVRKYIIVIPFYPRYFFFLFN